MKAKGVENHWQIKKKKKLKKSIETNRGNSSKWEKKEGCSLFSVC